MIRAAIVLAGAWLGGCASLSVTHVMPESTCEADPIKKMVDIRAQAEAVRAAVGMRALRIDSTRTAAFWKPDHHRVTISASEVRAALDKAHDHGYREALALLQVPVDTREKTDKHPWPDYLVAYFRKGRFATIDVNLPDAKTAAYRQVRRGLNIPDDVKLDATQEAALQRAADALVAQVCKTAAACTFLQAGGEEGYFFNRAGQKFGFPTVSFSIDPLSRKGYELTKIDEVQVVGDLTRVGVEAMFDELMHEAKLKPRADSKATGCAFDGYFTCVDPKDDAGQKKLKALNDSADLVEGVAGAAAAQVVRGLGWTSLNNEALAKMAQTLLSVSARKIAEAIIADNQSCKDHAEPRPMTVTLTVEGL